MYLESNARKGIFHYGFQNEQLIEVGPRKLFGLELPAVVLGIMGRIGMATKQEKVVKSTNHLRLTRME